MCSIIWTKESRVKLWVKRSAEPLEVSLADVLVARRWPLERTSFWIQPITQASNKPNASTSMRVVMMSAFFLCWIKPNCNVAAAPDPYLAFFHYLFSACVWCKRFADNNITVPLTERERLFAWLWCPCRAFEQPSNHDLNNTVHSVYSPFSFYWRDVEIPLEKK